MRFNRSRHPWHRSTAKRLLEWRTESHLRGRSIQNAAFTLPLAPTSKCVELAGVRWHRAAMRSAVVVLASVLALGCANDRYEGTIRVHRDADRYESGSIRVFSAQLRESYGDLVGIVTMTQNPAEPGGIIEVKVEHDPARVHRDADGRSSRGRWFGCPRMQVLTDRGGSAWLEPELSIDESDRLVTEWARLRIANMAQFQEVLSGSALVLKVCRDRFHLDERGVETMNRFGRSLPSH